MKKYLLTFTTMAFLATAGVCQEKEKKDHTVVPVAVKQAFAKQFSGVTPKWEKEDGQYEASFKKMNHDMSAVFNSDGSLFETETSMKVSELPQTILDYIKMNRKGTTIKEAAKIVKANGEINFEAEVGNKDLLFDESGKFLKEVKD